MFETLGVQHDVFPVDVWIDDEGLVRARSASSCEQQKDRVNIFRTTYRLSWDSRLRRTGRSRSSFRLRNDTIDVASGSREFFSEAVRVAG